jgi:hypothetical protein
MPDQKQAQSTAGNAVRTLDPELSQKLIALGFDPEAPVYEGSDWFNQNRIEEKLQETRPGPVILKFGGTNWDLPTHEEREASTWLAHVLVELATFQYETDTKGGEPDSPDYCCKRPQIYIRGFLTDTATDAEPDAPRVHVLIDLHEYDEDRPNPTAYFQVVDEPSPPDPDTVLVLGEGAPRGCQSSIT